MTTVAVLGTFDTSAENSESVARHIEAAGGRAIRIHRDEPWSSKIRKMLPSQVVYGTGFGFAAKLWALGRALGKRTINHWVGTDVLMALEDPRMRRMAQRAAPFIGQHLTVAPWLAQELETAGIRASLIPLVTPVRYDLRRGAGPAGVLAYLPDDRADFYGSQIVYAAARQLPEIPFAVLAGTQEKQPAIPNVRYFGWVDDIAPLYEQYPILLRVARHDGLPKMVLEALAFGNQVIFEYPLEGCHHARTEAEALSAIRDIVAESCPINEAGSRLVQEHYRHDQVVTALLQTLGVSPR